MRKAGKRQSRDRATGHCAWIKFAGTISLFCSVSFFGARYCNSHRDQVEVRVRVRCKEASCTVRFLVAQGGDGPDDLAQCESVKEYIECVSGISLLEPGISATRRLASESVVKQLPTRDMARAPTVHRQSDCYGGDCLMCLYCD